MAQRIRHLSVTDAIYHEIERCEVQALEVIGIVVSRRAIAGAVVAVPVPSMRPLREIWIHPEDWATLMHEHGLHVDAVGVYRVMGIGVRVERL